MADLKISQLTGATTPLAGTEVVPLVQSGTTKKVAVSDLTAGRAVTMSQLGVGTATPLTMMSSYDTSNAIIASQTTTGYSGFRSSGTGGNFYFAIDNNSGAGFGQGNYTRVLWSDGAYPVVIATNGTNRVQFESSGDVTVKTGNLIQGTAAKGVNFTANTPAAGMTSQLLNWYEEGTFTPALAFGGAGTGITYTTQTGYYTRIGRQVTLQIRIVLSSKGSATGAATIGGFPYNAGTGSYPAAIIDPSADFASLVAGGATFVTISSDTLYFMQQSTTGRTQMTQANFGNTAEFRFAITYNV